MGVVHPGGGSITFFSEDPAISLAEASISPEEGFGLWIVVVGDVGAVGWASFEPFLFGEGVGLFGGGGVDDGVDDFLSGLFGEDFESRHS